jgi:hypothetical protein
MPDTVELAPRLLMTVLVRCWSDANNEILVEVRSYSVYQAADDARNEHLDMPITIRCECFTGPSDRPPATT